MTRARRSRLALASAACALSAVTSASAGGSQHVTTVTFVGDSVPASISYTPAARSRLEQGLAVRLDLRECRRLVVPSCVFQGRAPTTGLQAVQGYGSALGDVLIVNVGYNESSAGYGAGIDRVMRAARRQGANRVVWVTLRETLDVYSATNRQIRAAARRWPELVVADWNSYSRGRPWFIRDGLHLTPAGARELALMLRRHVVR